MNVRVLKIYVLGLIDELIWMLWGWLLWVIDYLVDYGRLWWFWVMILFECEFVLEIRKEQWVFCWNYGLEVEDDENSIWSLNLWKLQFSPQTLENLQIGP